MTHYAKIAELVNVAESQLNKGQDPFLKYLLAIVEEHCLMAESPPSRPTVQWVSRGESGYEMVSNEKTRSRKRPG